MAYYDVAEKALNKLLASNPNIDRRLDRPDLTNDAREGITSFHRLQLFSHFKATRALDKLRAHLGRERFDETIKNYLKDGTKYIDGYDSFRLLIKPTLPDFESVEHEFEIR